MNLVFDLDGTICFNGKDIEANILPELLRINKEHNIIFASARPIRDMYPVLKNDFPNNDLIGGNGSIYKQNNEIKINGFKKEELSKILIMCESLNIPVLVDGKWDYFYNGPDNDLSAKLDTDNLASNVSWTELEEIIKVVFICSSQEQQSELELKIKSGLECEIHHFANEPIFDIVPLGINKANVVKHILNEEGYVAFGNDYNDIKLLNEADNGYIIGDDLQLSRIENINKLKLLEILKSF